MAPINRNAPPKLFRSQTGGIRVIRRQKVTLDAYPAALYGVQTKVFNQSVSTNREPFPEDFIFQLAAEEASALTSQIVTLEKGRGRYPKYAPLAFTEHGIASLSSVLNRPRAIEMNIMIIP